MTSRKLYGKLNSFMGTMRDGTARKMVEGQQVLIDYLQTKLAIYEEKLAEATSKERPELTDADRARLARAGQGLKAGVGIEDHVDDRPPVLVAVLLSSRGRIHPPRLGAGVKVAPHLMGLHGVLAVGIDGACHVGLQCL